MTNVTRKQVLSAFADLGGHDIRLTTRGIAEHLRVTERAVRGCCAHLVGQGLLMSDGQEQLRDVSGKVYYANRYRFVGSNFTEVPIAYHSKRRSSQAVEELSRSGINNLLPAGWGHMPDKAKASAEDEEGDCFGNEEEGK